MTDSIFSNQSEFGSEWCGWQLKTKPETVLERIVDPLGGLVLVETGVDAHQLLREVERVVDAIIGPGSSEASAFWSYYTQGNSRGTVEHKGDLLEAFPDQRAVLNQVYETTRDIMEPVETALWPPEPVSGGIPRRSLFVVAERRSQLRPTHTDFNLVTMWLGATRPAFQVMHEGKWLKIDDVPVGHALLWRGSRACSEGGGENLDPIKHYAKYRSVVRRLVMLS